jgi:hypothetical protein
MGAGYLTERAQGTSPSGFSALPWGEATSARDSHCQRTRATVMAVGADDYSLVAAAASYCKCA